MSDATNPYCHCLFFSSNVLARNVTRLAEEAFAGSGLAPSLAFVLMTVQRHPGIQPSDVAAVMMLSPSTVTRLVEKLEAKGLMMRAAEGKAIHLRLTDQGDALAPSLHEAWASAGARIGAALGGEKAKSLTEDVYAAALALSSR